MTYLIVNVQLIIPNNSFYRNYPTEYFRHKRQKYSLQK